MTQEPGWQSGPGCSAGEWMGMSGWLPLVPTDPGQTDILLNVIGTASPLSATWNKFQISWYLLQHSGAHGAGFILLMQGWEHLTHVLLCTAPQSLRTRRNKQEKERTDWGADSSAGEQHAVFCSIVSGTWYSDVPGKVSMGYVEWNWESEPKLVAGLLQSKLPPAAAWGITKKATDFWHPGLLCGGNTALCMFVNPPGCPVVPPHHRKGRWDQTCRVADFTPRFTQQTYLKIPIIPGVLYHFHFYFCQSFLPQPSDEQSWDSTFSTELQVCRAHRMPTLLRARPAKWGEGGSV